MNDHWTDCPGAPVIFAVTGGPAVGTAVAPAMVGGSLRQRREAVSLSRREERELSWCPASAERRSRFPSRGPEPSAASAPKAPGTLTEN